MKSSRRSSESSRKSPERSPPELWLVAVDPYTRERVRLALEPGATWCMLDFSTVHDAVDRGASAGDDPPVVLMPADHALDSFPALNSFPALLQAPMLLYGPVSALAALGDAACDDYLAEPWSTEELAYRLRRLVRRSLLSRSSVRCGEVTLRWGRYWVATDPTVDDRRVELSPVQHAMLDMLARAGDDPVPREALQAAVPEYGAASRAVDMHLSRLRSKLASVAGTGRPGPTIRCYRGVGYRIECR